MGETVVILEVKELVREKYTGEPTKEGIGLS